MDNNLTLIIQSDDRLEIKLQHDKAVIDRVYLTIDQSLDSMLISAIDKLLLRNRIDRLSLKSLKIQGKTRPEAVSGMITAAIRNGLEV